MPQTGYAIADIAALKAIGSGDRVDGYSRLVKQDINQKPAWYTFISANTEPNDENLVILPDDSPSSGRWLKTNVYDPNSSNMVGPGWKIIDTNSNNFYSANSFEKILIQNYSGRSLQISLPNTPSPGDSLQFISTNSGVDVDLLLNNVGYVGQFYWTGLKFNSAYKIRSLIFPNPSIGWIPSQDTDFTPYSSGSGY